jgi:hypothetical protein
MRRPGPTSARLIRLSAIAVLLGAIVRARPPDATLFWTSLFDLGHVPLFGGIALLLRRLWSGGTNRGGPGPFLTTAGIAACVEVLQTLQPGRSASMADLAYGLAGAGAFLLLARARDQQVATLRTAGSHAVVGAALAMLLGASVPFAVATAVYVARDRAVPSLFRLDGSWHERPFVHATNATLTPRAHPPSSGPLARLDLLPGGYPALTLDEPFPDWTPFREFVFTVVSPIADDVPLFLRIHDAAHINHQDDRFNMRLLIRPGENRIAIPLEAIRKGPKTRDLDLRRVRAIILFTNEVTEPTPVFIGAFALK